jgi:hypothetical protein
VGVPAVGVAGAVGAVEMTPAVGQRRLAAGGDGPGHRVGGGQQVGVAAQAEDFDAEAVQPGDAAAVQGGQDPAGLGGVLTPADAADPDQRLNGNVDAAW